MNSKKGNYNLRSNNLPFTGTCDHYGIKGHVIRDCRKASDAIKAEWLKPFNERKDAKRKHPEDIKS